MKAELFHHRVFRGVCMKVLRVGLCVIAIGMMIDGCALPPRRNPVAARREAALAGYKGPPEIQVRVSANQISTHGTGRTTVVVDTRVEPHPENQVVYLQVYDAFSGLAIRSSARQLAGAGSPIQMIPLTLDLWVGEYRVKAILQRDGEVFFDTPFVQIVVLP